MVSKHCKHPSNPSKAVKDSQEPQVQPADPCETPHPECFQGIGLMLLFSTSIYIWIHAGQMGVLSDELEESWMKVLGMGLQVIFEVLVCPSQLHVG